MIKFYKQFHLKSYKDNQFVDMNDFPNLCTTYLELFYELYNDNYVEKILFLKIKKNTHTISSCAVISLWLSLFYICLKI